MPQLYSTGPCLIWVRIPISIYPTYDAEPPPPSYPLFLGTCESAPYIYVRPGWEPYHSDLGGTKIAYDTAYAGQDGLVQGMLNRYCETVYKILADRAALVNPLAPPEDGGCGNNASGELGSYMLTENLTYDLWTVFPYASKAAFNQEVNGNMPACYHFPGAYLMGPDRQRVGSGVAKAVLMNWHCLRVPSTPSLDLGDFATGSWTLYDFDASALNGYLIF